MIFRLLSKDNVKWVLQSKGKVGCSLKIKWVVGSNCSSPSQLQAACLPRPTTGTSAPLTLLGYLQFPGFVYFLRVSFRICGRLAAAQSHFRCLCRLVSLIVFAARIVAPPHSFYNHVCVSNCICICVCNCICNCVCIEQVVARLNGAPRRLPPCSSRARLKHTRKTSRWINIICMMRMMMMNVMNMKIIT